MSLEQKYFNFIIFYGLNLSLAGKEMKVYENYVPGFIYIN